MLNRFYTEVSPKVLFTIPTQALKKENIEKGGLS